MNKVRKGVLWLLTLVMIISAVPGSAFAQYDVSQNTYIDARKTLSGKTGEKTTLNLIFTNKAGYDLKGVAVMFDKGVARDEFEATSDAAEETAVSNGSMFPFEISSSTFDAKILGTVKQDSSKTFSLTARVRRDLSEGYYTVPLLIKTGGDEFRRERVNIWITKSSGTTASGSTDGTIQFELGENQSTPFGTYPSVMDYNMNVRNSSELTAFDVNIRMTLDQDSTKFPFDINDGNYTKHYDRIGGGETVAVPYSLSIRKEVYSGYYPIAFTIEYRDSTEGDVQKAQGTFYVKIQNKEKEEDTKEFNANDRTKARLIVDGFKTNPETVYAGDEFELTLYMKNASENVAASNILFSLESEKVSDSAVFTTDSSSSAIVVNSLGAGQTTDVKVKMRAGAWVDQRTYSLTINEKYDSPEFKNAEEKVSVNIPVRQEARLNTGTIDIMPDSISVGSETNVMFPINNTGKVLLYNVMVNFVGDTIQQTSTYVGNIKPGETGNVDAMVTGSAATADDGKIKVLITYEDENGVVSDPIEKEITLTVTEASDIDTGMEDIGVSPADAAPQGIARYRRIIIGAVIVILAAGLTGAVIILKKRKMKKAEAEEGVEDEI
ncbi:hypothetical protein [Clostridium sp. HBUAS56010]|uniref:COG1361 S-layer family protein n=1 Tax=Clostridium sp. HBUAS56010 TaxID=2571127 RepID=UPI001177DDEB|nr:hypothetical protein [Clostridium sp. HBUAS56010]